MKKGDLVRARGTLALWTDDGAKMKAAEEVTDGQLLMFVGRGKYKFVRVLHPVFGIRQIYGHHVKAVSNEGG